MSGVKREAIIQNVDMKAEITVRTYGTITDYPTYYKCEQ